MKHYCCLLTILLHITSLFIRPAPADVDQGHLESEYVMCLQRDYGSNIGVEYNAEIVEYWCIEKVLFAKTNSVNLDGVQTAWLASLYESYRQQVVSARNGNFQIRQRKEYRMLSLEERTIFHRAVEAFKQDRARKYEALTSLHVGDASRNSQGGPAFLPWNRIFLILFELALREYESDVVLPYWDNTLDSQLEHPTKSLIWSPDYAGNGNGRVVTGPFVRWNILGRELIRNTGESGRLMKPTDVTRLLTTSLRISDITFPNAAFLNNLELQSYGVRLWVGGDMALLETATNDPMYFLMGAYIDYIWQQFRDQQELAGVDPQIDYPTKFDSTAHLPNAPLRVVSDTVNRAALSDVYGKRMHQYVPPSCSPDGLSCGSTGALRCHSASNQCEAVEGARNVADSCKGSSGYQNSYCLDGNNCDERDWVYLAMEVIYNRPPGYTYPSKTFTSTGTVSTEDVYSPAKFSASGNYSTARGVLDSFLAPQVDACRCSERDTGRVYVQSFGLDYSGVYREYSIVDKRLPLSSVWTSVAVKDPRDSSNFQIRALVRVYDECGRICRIHCRTPGFEEYQICSGAIILTTRKPKQYSETIEDSYYKVWKYSSEPTPYPQRQRDLTYLKVYCDHSALWPWVNFGIIDDQLIPPPNPPTDIDLEDLLVATTTTTTTTLAPTTTTTTTTTTTLPPTTVLIPPETCFNETECFEKYEPVNCTRCEHGTFTLCWDDCQRYLHCAKGIWYVKGCADGLLWDDGEDIKTCNYMYNVDCRPDAVCTGCRQPRPISRTRGFGGTG